MSHGCPKDGVNGSVTFQVCFMGVSRLYTVVSRFFHGFFKGVFRMMCPNPNDNISST